MEDYKVDWIECDLNAVMKYFAADFEMKDREVWRRDWFIDPAKGKVLFKIESRRKEPT
jgi:hypothetical protein